MALKISLIESLWEGVPVSAYVVNRTGTKNIQFDNLLLDGQQRWTSIRDYVNDEFSVFGGLYSEFSIEQKPGRLYSCYGGEHIQTIGLLNRF